MFGLTTVQNTSEALIIQAFSKQLVEGRWICICMKVIIILCPTSIPT
jgi:hypothetical protein